MSAYYLDTSARAKLLTGERGAEGLRRVVAVPGVSLLSSRIFVVELRRVVARWALGVDSAAERRLATSLCDDLVGRVGLMPITETVIERAAVVPPSGLRSLGAMHLATALILNEHSPLTGLLTFDRSLAAAAMAAGVDSPDLAE